MRRMARRSIRRAGRQSTRRQNRRQRTRASTGVMSQRRTPSCVMACRTARARAQKGRRPQPAVMRSQTMCEPSGPPNPTRRSSARSRARPRPCMPTLREVMPCIVMHRRVPRRRRARLVSRKLRSRPPRSRSRRRSQSAPVQVRRTPRQILRPRAADRCRRSCTERGAANPGGGRRGGGGGSVAAPQQYSGVAVQRHGGTAAWRHGSTRRSGAASQRRSSTAAQRHSGTAL